MNNRELVYLAAARFAAQDGMMIEDAVKKALDLMCEMDVQVMDEYDEGWNSLGKDGKGPMVCA